MKIISKITSHLLFLFLAIIPCKSQILDIKNKSLPFRFWRNKRSYI